MQLVRLTSDDYPKYRKTYARISYSIFRKGEEQFLDQEMVRKAVHDQIKTRTKFLKEVNDPNYEFYFYTDHNGQIQGFVELIFDGCFCNLYEFAVFQKGKGLGAKLYSEIQNIIQQRGCKKIILWCPFEGSKVFWRKMGFSSKPNDIFIKRI